MFEIYKPYTRTKKRAQTMMELKTRVRELEKELAYYKVLVEEQELYIAKLEGLPRKRIIVDGQGLVREVSNI